MTRRNEWQHPHRDPTGPWTKHAACHARTDTMYAIDDRTTRTDRPTNRHTPNETHAIAICNTCPVKQECLQHAIDNDERWGVWGGTTPRERWDQLKRKAVCVWCNTTYTPTHMRQRLCSDTCRQDSYRRRDRNRYYRKVRD